jgi:hypothetical protein
VAWHFFNTPLQITTVLHQIGASLLGWPLLGFS